MPDLSHCTVERTGIDMRQKVFCIVRWRCLAADLCSAAIKPLPWSVSMGPQPLLPGGQNRFLTRGRKSHPLCQKTPDDMAKDTR